MKKLSSLASRIASIVAAIVLIIAAIALFPITIPLGVMLYIKGKKWEKEDNLQKNLFTAKILYQKMWGNHQSDLQNSLNAKEYIRTEIIILKDYFEKIKTKFLQTNDGDIIRKEQDKPPFLFDIKKVFEEYHNLLRYYPKPINIDTCSLDEIILHQREVAEYHAKFMNFCNSTFPPIYEFFQSMTDQLYDMRHEISSL